MMIEIADLKDKGEIIQTNDDIRVSVCMVTYNQKKYIAQAIESVLMQKTNFKFQLLIGDDASTDGTTEIVREYAEKYPDIIKPIFHKKNIGAGNNSISIYKKVNTEYVAVCDGDDYWIDEYKLQKQVDFLDKNKDFTGVFTRINVVKENGVEIDILPINYCIDMWKNKGFFSPYDFLQYYCILPVSVMWRWQIKDFSSPLFDFEDHIGDITLGFIHAKHGKIGFIDGITACYRRHETAMWQFKKETLLLSEDNRIKYIKTYVLLKKYYGAMYTEDFDRNINRIFDNCLKDAIKEDNVPFIKILISEYPHLFLLREKAKEGGNFVFKRIKKIYHMLSYVLILQILSIIGVIIWLAAK